MKTNLVITLSFLSFAFTTRAQAPVMNPIQGPDTVCLGLSSQPFFYTASASNFPTQFTWLPTAGVQFSGYTSPGVSVQFLGPGMYTLSAWASNSSGASAPVVKYVNAIQTPSVTFSGGGYVQYCQGSSTTFMASNTTNAGSSTLQYLWTPSYGLSSTNTWSTIASPSISTIYTVNVSLINCSSATQVSVDVLPAPVITVSSNNNPMCKGEKATITISGTGVTYSVNGVASPLTFTVNPTSSQNYVVSALTVDGCDGQMTFAQNVSLCTAVQKIREDLNALIVYPNPSTGDVRLRAGHDQRVALFNQLGAMLKQIDLKAGEEASLKDLDPGVYFLTAEGKTSRLVITR